MSNNSPHNFRQGSPVNFYNCSTVCEQKIEEPPKKYDTRDAKLHYTATAPSMDPFVTGAMLDLSNLSELGKFPIPLRKVMSPK